MIKDYTSNPTCSTIFLVHQLNIDVSDLKDKNIGFINAYLRDKHRTKIHPGMCLYLLFKPKDFDTFNYFMEAQKENDIEILEDYDYDGGYVVLVYQMPARFQKDYDKFEKGQYSKFSEEFKERYGKTNRAYDIINKTDNIKEYWRKKLDYDFDNDKDAELWSKPDIESETLDIYKFIEDAN